MNPPIKRGPGNFRRMPPRRGFIPGRPTPQKMPQGKPAPEKTPVKPQKESIKVSSGGGKQEEPGSIFQPFKGYTPITRFSNDNFRKNRPNINKVLLGMIFVVTIIIVIVLLFNKTGKVSESSMSSEDLDMQIKNVQIQEDSSVKVNVNVDPKKEKIIGIKFIFEDEDGTEIIKKDISITQLSEQEFVFNLKEVDSRNLKKILVAPIFEGKKQSSIMGSVKDSYIPEKENSYEQENQYQQEYEEYLPEDYYDYYQDYSNQTNNQTSTQNQAQLNNTTTNQTQQQNQTEINNSVANQTQVNNTNQTQNQSCISHAIFFCYNNNVYWYNSCGKREGIKQECNSTQICTYDSCVNNLSQQTQTTPVCGNGILEIGEFCDKTNLGGETCQSLGFNSGILGCRKNCVFDIRYCSYSTNSDSSNSNFSQCISYYSSSCDAFTGDVYWYDSCGNRQERKEDCFSDEKCENGKCVLNITTNA
jgi:hypothetical protein